MFFHVVSMIAISLFIFADFIKWYNEPPIIIENKYDGVLGINGILCKEGIDGIIDAGTYSMNNHHVIQ